MPRKRVRVRNALWTMPQWMVPFIPMIAGGGSREWIEEIMNDHRTTVFENAPRALVCVSMKGQVGMLAKLHESGNLSLLPMPLSPEGRRP